MNSRTGLITVRNCRRPGSTGCIDYERQQQHVLQVRAVDRQGEGLQATVTVVVNVTDANDNPPLFPQDEYGITVRENRSTFENPLIVEVSNLHMYLFNSPMN